MLSTTTLGFAAGASRFRQTPSTGPLTRTELSARASEVGT